MFDYGFELFSNTNILKALLPAIIMLVVITVPVSLIGLFMTKRTKFIFISIVYYLIISNWAVLRLVKSLIYLYEDPSDNTSKFKFIIGFIIWVICAQYGIYRMYKYTIKVRDRINRKLMYFHTYMFFLYSLGGFIASISVGVESNINLIIVQVISHITVSTIFLLNIITLFITPLSKHIKY